MERTLVLIKPDAIQRDLIGKIITRFEEKGLHIAGLKMMALSDDVIADHYSHLTDKPFFPELRGFMQQSPVIAICLHGPNCVEAVRRIVGVTNSIEAEPGSIRGDFGMSIQANLVHASDSVENAEIEVARFFEQAQLFSYDDALTNVAW
ncbi:MAG: nucleoside-diphosphate kinase [Chloroflexota bacterium]